MIKRDKADGRDDQMVKAAFADYYDLTNAESHRYTDYVFSKVKSVHLWRFFYYIILI